MANLFDYTSPAEGDRFIGRRDECDYIWERIFQNALNGNVANFALTGMNKIGKTSIVKKLCKQFEDGKYEDVFLIKATLQGREGFWQFWINEVIIPLINMINLTALEEKDSDWAEEITKCKNYFESKDVKRLLFSGDVVEHDDAKEKVKMMFSILGYWNKRTILVFDEFDCATELFGSKEANFSWLRTLLQAGYGISMLTLSRRSIYYIETSAFGGSTLHGIFETYGLYGFKNCDIDEYFNRLADYHLTQEQKEDILYFCGRSPYYLAIMGDTIENGGLEQTDDIETLFSMKGTHYYDNFNAIVGLLKEEGLLNAMLQMFVGPVYRLYNDDLNRLIGMGYCMKQENVKNRADGSEYVDYFTKENNRKFLTMSDRFVEYLADVKRKEVGNLWPVLSHTERLLRKVIQLEAMKDFGDTWETGVNELIDGMLSKEKDKIRIEQFFVEYSNRYRRLYKNAENGAGCDVGCCKLNVVSILVLKDIFLNDWSRYEVYFVPHVAEKVEHNLLVLHNARNPLAHGNTELLTDAQVEDVTEICDDMTAAISSVVGA